MNKILSFVFLLVSCTQIGFAQDIDALKQSALRDAYVLAGAMKSFDISTILDYTHPTVVEISGGKEQLLAQLASTFEDMKAQNFVFEKTEIIGVLSLKKEQGEYRCIVKNNNYMSVNGNKVVSRSHLLGFYNPDKEIWYFVEAAKMKSEQARAVLFPDFETSLEIPDDVHERL